MTEKNTHIGDEALFRAFDIEISNNGSALLKGFDVELAPSEMVALFGNSGCGKTTLLRVLCGLINPASGSVLFRGEDPDSIGWPGYRRKVLYVEQRAVMFNDTVEGNLRRPFNYKTSQSEFPEDWARELIGKALLSESVMGRNARELSEGEKQRVSIVRALIIKPEVLLLDEPIASLDDDSAGAVEELISHEVRKNQIGTLVVSHNRERAIRWCDRVIELDKYLVDGGKNCMLNGEGN